MDLFDPKPGLAEHRGEDLPDSIRKGQRITTMTSGQKSFPIAPSIFNFNKHGECGAEISELLPYTAKIAEPFVVPPLVRSAGEEPGGAVVGQDHAVFLQRP